MSDDLSRVLGSSSRPGTGTSLVAFAAMVPAPRGPGTFAGRLAREAQTGTVKVMEEEDPTTQELRVDQVRREAAERERAEQAPTEDAAEQHARRAERNAFLRERLEQRAEAERQAARKDAGEAADDARGP